MNSADGSRNPIPNDTSDDGLEELIQWHRDRAAWYDAAKPATEGDRQTFYRNKCHHLTTAELLQELACYR